ncbi:MAG: helix-turn-helix domain-containing protein [Spirochaetaceae bacterium]|jgi:hypothetical protein|nr:helix-turn-helix domain-containing protein [Spirochaetaceae bacterium]
MDNEVIEAYLRGLVKISDTFKEVCEDAHRQFLEAVAAKESARDESGRGKGADGGGLVQSDFLTLEKAAEYTTLSESKLRKLAANGEIAVCKTSHSGRSVFWVQDLKAYLMSRRVPTNAEMHEKADTVCFGMGGRRRKSMRRKEFGNVNG